MARTTKNVTFTLMPDTIQRLEQYASEHHSSKSKAITDLIWAAKVGDRETAGKGVSNNSGSESEE